MGKVTIGNNWTGTVGISADFLEMMPDTVTFNGTTAMDKYGKKTYGGSDVTVRCRIVYDTTLVKNDQGQEMVNSGVIYLYGDYSILTLGHQITLPNGAQPIITKITSKKDTANAVHHTLVNFGQ